jgi:hypothetical protein
MMLNKKTTRNNMENILRTGTYLPGKFKKNCKPGN